MHLLEEISFFIDYIRFSIQGEIGMAHVDVIWIRRRISTKDSPFFPSLTSTERDLLKYRIGLKGGRPHTVEELSEKFGISIADVLLIQEKALTQRARRPRSDSGGAE